MRTEEIFSKRLKSSMGKMTQRQLAAKVGTTEVTVSRWLNGSRIPKLTDAVRIASVLNVSLDYLSGISEFPKDRDKKVIPLEKALDFCEKERQRWHAYKLKALECYGTWYRPNLCPGRSGAKRVWKRHQADLCNPL